MQTTRSPGAFFPHFPPELFKPVPSGLLAWADRQRQRAALARLEDRMLADIGVSRAEAEARRHN
ncbi:MULTISPECIES: DUF1127 domain-containing protein [Tabrizicola]|uniref:DUF1127 domain-containing protein n=1 Tax=Tabrizicola TaxID=1443919 RepID=UPI001081685A|nr:MULTISPECIES: DUF1127 domain-containing protein [Paracoccaceae]